MRKKFGAGALALAMSVLVVAAMPAGAAEDAVDNNIYVSAGEETSWAGKGTVEEPYESIQYAMSQAKAGAVIHLTEDVVVRSGQFGVDFLVPKDLSFDGSGHTLTLRGADIELEASARFSNLHLSMIPEGTGTPAIYAGGHELELSRVETKVSAQQSDVRPVIYAGTKDRQVSGPLASISILESTSETVFKSIVAGDPDEPLFSPVRLNLDGEVKVLDSVVLGGDFTAIGRVNVATSSARTTRFVARNSRDNSISFSDVNLSGVQVEGIQDLHVAKGSVATRGFTGVSDELYVGAGAVLRAVDSSKEITVGRLAGEGEFIIPSAGELKVSGNVEGPLTVSIDDAGTGADYPARVGTAYVTVKGDVESEPTVKLYRENPVYRVAREANNVWKLAAGKLPVQSEVFVAHGALDDRRNWVIVHTHRGPYVSDNTNDYYGRISGASEVAGMKLVKVTKEYRDGSLIAILWVYAAPGSQAAVDAEAANNAVLEPAPQGEVDALVGRELTMHVRNSLTSGVADATVRIGKPGDAIIAGDWDADGIDTFAVRRGRTVYFMADLEATRILKTIEVGQVGDTIVAGDWNNDGMDTFALRRGNEMMFFSSLDDVNPYMSFSYGRVGDVVLVGDWNRDGVDTLMVRRGNMNYLNNVLAGGIAEVEFGYGRVGDTLLVGDWNGDGRDTMTIRRANIMYPKNAFEAGEADYTYSYGRVNDHVIVGDWDNNQVDTAAVPRTAADGPYKPF